MKTVYRRIVLVDDEAIQNKIHKMMIQRQIGRHYIEIVSFTDPAQAVIYLQEENEAKVQTLVFLDLYMPQLSGWEFLDHLRYVDLEFTHICIVSSSTNLADIEKAYSHPKVTTYFEKPLNSAIEGILSGTLAALAGHTSPKP